MKKALVILLSTFMIMGTVGCSKQNPSTNGDGNKDTAQAGTIQGNGEELMYFGKISKIVGNEVEINIAKEDFTGDSDGETGESGFGTSSSSGEQGAVEDLGSGVNIEVSEPTSDSSESTAAPAGSTEMKQEIIDSGSSDLKLEYTGDNKNFTIPAGAKILDFRSGKMGKISDVKEGAIIRIYTKKTGDVEVVCGLDIVQ